MEYVLFASNEKMPFTRFPRGSQVLTGLGGDRKWSDFTSTGNPVAGLDISGMGYSDVGIFRVPKDNVIMPMDIITLESGGIGWVQKFLASPSGYGVLYTEDRGWDSIVLDGNELRVGSISKRPVKSVHRAHPLELIKLDTTDAKCIYGSTRTVTIGEYKISCFVKDGEPMFQCSAGSGTINDVVEAIDLLESGPVDAPTIEEYDVIHCGKDKAVVSTFGNELRGVLPKKAGWDRIYQDTMLCGRSPITKIERAVAADMHSVWYFAHCEDDTHKLPSMYTIWEAKSPMMFGDRSISVDGDKLRVGCTRVSKADLISLRDTLNSLS
jgi:hypothetical protein